jgi:hypothetical protein
VTRDHEFADDYLFFRFVGIHGFGNDALTNAIREIDDDISAGVSSIHASVSTDIGTNASEKDQALATIAVALKTYVNLMDRRYHFSIYPACFIAREAVDHLFRSGVANTRNQAVDTVLVCNNIFHIFEHVTQDHEFRDDYLFVFFVDSMVQEISIVDERHSHAIHTVDCNGNSPPF